MGMMAVASVALSSCSDDEGIVNPGAAESRDLVLSVALPGGTSSRATTNDDNDHWSYNHFQLGDQLGFFSGSGNYQVDNGKGPINNALLTCEDNEATNGYYRFRANGVQMVQQYLKSSTVFFYFPYDSGITSSGMELRRPMTGIDGKEVMACVDFLSGSELNVSDLANGQLSGTFQHTFSELIIMRGDGFDNPKADHAQIKVVMKNGYTHILATPKSDPWKLELSLANRPDTQSGDAADTRVWEAWKGEIYRETGWTEGKEAWYVVIPTLPGAPTEIDYIELYDNEDNLQRVTAMSLMNGGRYVESGWRYPIEITMNELVPTVFPYGILPWSTNIDVTYENERGISNISQFLTWKSIYDDYVNTRADHTEELLNYGDRVVDTEGNFLYWQFYILSDLNFKNAPGLLEGEPIIPVLNDKIDAQSHTFASDGFSFINHRLSNLPGPLVGTMNGYGALENINIVTSSFVSSSAGPVGLLINTMNGGLIDNCNVINASLVGNGPVGMAAGNALGGKITGCSFSGLLVGSESYAGNNYITGNDPVGTEITNNVSTVIFSK